MTVNQMYSTTVHEAEKMLRILQNHNIKCSLELHVEQGSDPIMAMVDAAVKVDYFEDTNDGRILLVDLNGADFSFSENQCSFYKFNSSSQITICISSDRFAAWFHSDTLTLKAITEL